VGFAQSTSLLPIQVSMQIAVPFLGSGIGGIQIYRHM
jgi:hypothetical protein